MQLLLISNSTLHGEGYLDYCMSEILDVLGHRRRVAFVPFALHDREGYAARAGARFDAEGLEVRAMTADATGREVLEWAEAIFTGGGNTFRLLKTLQDSGLLSEVRERVKEGVAYMGASAGSNIAAPTIRTTNDMPIVQPESFDALDLVPFQINPHYIDSDASSTHMGETRGDRLREFLEENDTPVVALREGAWIRVKDGCYELGGSTGGLLFERGRAPRELGTGSSIELEARVD